jgi:crotonobetainyl-CoA:carnitine CoA-transferase CaiB-like acyl-CoA transferase
MQRNRRFTSAERPVSGLPGGEKGMSSAAEPVHRELPAGALPLDGVVVLDLSDAALAQASRLLADLGATVVRVERPDGDELRRRAPYLDGEAELEHGLAHLLYNFGKLSAALDLDSAEGWEAVERLTAAADVVIAPLVKNRFALLYCDGERFAAAHPGVGLVDVVVRRGQPDLVASDLVAVARGGLLYCNGFPDRPPDYPIGFLGYKQGSINAAAVAAAMALGRRRHGRGAVAGISLEEAAMSTTIQAANQNLWTWMGAVGKRAGVEGLSYPVLGKDGTVALLGAQGALFPTADGRWVVFGMTPFTLQRWDAFVAWLHELTGDGSLLGEQWHDAAYRSAHSTQSHAAMAKLCALLPRDELAGQGQARGLMIVPVNAVDDIAADTHLRERGYFPEVPHPALGRTLPALRSPFRSTAYEPPQRPAPALGEHTRAVLSRLGGMTESEIEQLQARGVAGKGEQHDARLPDTASTPVRGAGAPRDALPLAGYRVVDFTWQAAGPLMTEFLANLGADVVRIESATRVDTVRLYSHPLQHASIDTGAFFNDCNTGKRSTTLNLSTPEGLAIAGSMIARADVVTSNFTPGQMERWGFGHEGLKRIRPDIIVASLPVMGRSGPKCGWRGIGNSVVAMSGLALHMGFPDRPPIGLGTLQTDFTVPIFGVTAIIAALLQRERTGEGQDIEIAQFESALHLLDTELLEYLVNGAVAPRRGNRSPLYAPHGLYPCAGDDRWIALSIGNALEWQQLCLAIGRPDLLRRPQLCTLEGRRAVEDELDEAISTWTRQQVAEEAEAQLQRLGVAAAAVQHVGDLVEHNPGLREFFLELEHPAGVPMRVQNQPFDWNGRRLTVTRGPLLGEDNEAVLCGELGLDRESFIDLMVRQVVY